MQSEKYNNRIRDLQRTKTEPKQTAAKLTLEMTQIEPYKQQEAAQTLNLQRYTNKNYNKNRHAYIYNNKSEKSLTLEMTQA